MNTITIAANATTAGATTGPSPNSGRRNGSVTDMTDTTDETPTPDVDTTPSPIQAAPAPKGIRLLAPSFARTGKNRRLVF